MQSISCKHKLFLCYFFTQCAIKLTTVIWGITRLSSSCWEIVDMRQKNMTRVIIISFLKMTFYFWLLKLLAYSVVSLIVIFRKTNSEYENPFSFRANLVFTMNWNVCEYAIFSTECNMLVEMLGTYFVLDL